MNESDLLRALRAFYDRHQIAVGPGFDCEHKTQCIEAASALGQTLRHHGAEALVGDRYGWPFKIAIVSASMGGGVRQLRDSDSLMQELRRQFTESKLNPHMRGTLEILAEILEPDIRDGDDVFRHFALTNSAKCSLDHAGDPPGPCFQNCSHFVLPELKVLCPDLVISQGTRARDALLCHVAGDAASQVIDRFVRAKMADADHPVQKMVIGILKEHFRVLRVAEGKAIWLMLVHPSDRGGRWQQLKRQHVLPFLGWSARRLVNELHSLTC